MEHYYVIIDKRIYSDKGEVKVLFSTFLALLFITAASGRYAIWQRIGLHYLQ